MKTTVWPDRSDNHTTLLFSERPTDNPSFPCTLFCDAYLVRHGEGPTRYRYSVSVQTGSDVADYWSVPLGIAADHIAEGGTYSNPAFDRATTAALVYLLLGHLRSF
jgi:hypothetical protein